MESGFRSKSVLNEVFKKATENPIQVQEMTESSDSDSRIARFGR
jgi:hypothetical protein